MTARPNFFSTSFSDSTNIFNRLVWLMASIVMLAGAYVAFAPFAMSVPYDNLDSSWVTVTGEAGARGFIFGDDIVITVGPLSSLYTHYLDEHQFWLKLALRLFVVAAFSVLAITLARRERRPLPAILFALGLLAGPSPDALIISVPALTALIAIRAGVPRLQLSAFCLGIVTTAILTLAKFSVAMLAISAFLITDVWFIYWRRIPVHLLAYVVVLFILFSALDTPASFTHYLAYSLSVALGYTEAMAIAGIDGEALGFVALATLIFAAIVASETWGVRKNLLTPSEAFARVAVLAAYVYLMWKYGFVRQDLHSLGAWWGLVMAVLIYAMIAPRSSSTTRLSDFAGATAAAVVATAILFGVVPSVIAEKRPELKRDVLGNLRQRLAEAKDFAAGPSLWLEHQQSLKANAWEAIRRARPLPHLDGTVDVIPSIQSAVLANGLNYSPRPSFLECGTYTPLLIELNRRHLIERGADYLLFQPGSIDGRYPALAEGPSWPDILRYYAPAFVAGDLLVLRRRTEPIAQPLLVNPVNDRSRFGKKIAVPPSSDPQFMRVAIRETVLGRLANLLMRPSLISMDVTFDDGRTKRFRVIPAIANAGFMISPAVFSSREFLAVATGRSAGRVRNVKSVKFVGGRLEAWLYRPKFELTFATLAVQLLQDQALPESVANQIETNSALLTMARSVPVQIGVTFVEEGLLAHPPVSLSLSPEAPASGLDLAYGIRDGAWQADRVTDGVCFKISRLRESMTEVVFDRCLDPRAHVSDRGEQHAHIAADFLTTDTLLFETSCRDNCNYDWSYWSEVVFTHDK